MPDQARAGSRQWPYFLAIAIALTAGISRLPWHMDEYVMYHTLACWNPTQQLNSFREACPGNLTQLWEATYYRAYAYIGITSSLLMAPFHALWPSLAMNTWVGIAWTALSGLGLTKSLKLQRAYLGAIFLYFPISYSIIHDGGPIRASFAAICWLPYLLERLMSDRSKVRKLMIWLLTLALWLICIEDKPFFLYLVPGSYIFSASCLLLNLDQARSKRRAGLLMTLVFSVNSIFSIILLYLMRANGEPYLMYLRSNSPEWSQRISELGTSLRFFLDWPFFASRITEYSKLSLAGSVATFIVLCTIVWALRHCPQQREPRNSQFLALIACFTYWFFSWIAGGKFHHHFVFAQLPLLAIVMVSIQQGSQKTRSTLVMLLSMASVLSLAAVLVAPKIWYASSNTNALVRETLSNTQEKTIINSSNWGLYYAYSLADNNGHSLVWADTIETMNKLEKTARDKQSIIIHFCWNCEQSLLAEGYPNSKLTLIDENKSHWKSYKVKPY